MAINKKRNVADIMSWIRDRVDIVQDPNRIPPNPFEGRLSWHVSEAKRAREVRLPAVTRFSLIKRLLLRLMRVYTRYLEIFNYNISEYLVNLNAKVNFLTNHLEKQIVRTRDDLDYLSAAYQGREPDSPEKGFNYLQFENYFRGEETEIANRFRTYLPHIEECQRILDLGCGRGEFLEVVKERGIAASGIDQDAEMVALCKEKGLDVQQADALNYLRDSSHSWDCIFISHVVEHLRVLELVELIRLCYEHLEPAGLLIIETPNPQCLLIYSGSFAIDPTHVRPIHPATLLFFLIEQGFVSPVIEYKTPHQKLQSVPEADTEFKQIFNATVERLNEVLFSNQDYAAIARKPE